MSAEVAILALPDVLARIVEWDRTNLPVRSRQLAFRQNIGKALRFVERLGLQLEARVGHVLAFLE